MSTSQTILDPDFLRKLEHLSLVSKRALIGGAQGRRRSRRHGTSIEFADYRDYKPGDDLRYVDWKAYGRLDKLFLKLFLEEEDLKIHLLLDVSKSMDFGHPFTKLDYARRTAAALGYIALSEYDRISLALLSSGSIEVMPSAQGRPGRAALLRFLEANRAPKEKTDLESSLTRYAAQSGMGGIAIILSDFFDPSTIAGLKTLLARRHQVILLHILDDEELHPSITGDLRLMDSETSEGYEVSISPYLLAQYEVRVKNFCDGLRDQAMKYGMDYVQIATSVPIEDVLLQYLRRVGLVR